jgi:enamidase
MRRSWECQAAGRRRNDVDLAPLGDVPAELAFCFATGNTARMRELDCGLIEVGRSADFVIMDKAQHSAGKTIPRQRAARRPARHRHDHHRRDRPPTRSRNTPPATKVPEMVIATA